MYALNEAHLARLLDAVEIYVDRGRQYVLRRVEAGEEAFVAYWSAGLGARLERASSWLRMQRAVLLPS